MDSNNELVPGNKTPEDKIGDLTKKVAIKLIQDAIKGVVGILHDEKTGETEIEHYSMYLKSTKIPLLNVSMWRSFIPEKSAFPMDPSRLLVTLNEHKWGRGKKMAIKQRWETPENYEVHFFEGENRLSPEAIAEFLNDILETEFDQKETERNFNIREQAYRPPDGKIFTQQWVHDLIEGETLPEGPLPD